jgi:hypothetical protein
MASPVCRRHCRPFTYRFTSLAFLAAALLAADAALAVDFSVGGIETIYSKSQRGKKGLKYWPDGNLGVVPLGNGLYDFYAANSSKSVKTTGTLTDLGKGKKSVKITGIPKKTFNYVAGGPIYYDPVSGARLMIYHAEKHGKSKKDFYSVLGMAVSTDPEGRKFQDLGTIIEPNLQTGQTEVGGGSFAVFDDHLHVYYRDWFPNGTTSELAVARAPLTTLVANALSGLATPFAKYYDGSWSQPGRGGLSSALETGNPANAWSAVSYNEYLDELVLVSSQWTPQKSDLYLATSPDGVNWSPRQPLALDVGEQFYPTIIGTGADPTQSGQSFYVYYTDSVKGEWSRWKDAKLVRRQITFDPYSPFLTSEDLTQLPPNNLPVDLPGDIQPPAPPGWLTVADYHSDFQPGTPADGWTYAWNPNGKVKDPAKFAALMWSQQEGVYNTTGAATQTPAGKKTHKDDYLSLSSTGGHPGKPKYHSIAGYTIQEEDGAGEYRLVDSSISKTDSVTEKKEDGLRVSIFRNNALLGSQNVSTSGAPASFDRALGNLNVGDTIWVMIDALKNHSYDAFAGFDFSIQKSVPLDLVAPAMNMMLGASPVPEPATSTLFLAGLAALAWRRPRRNR